jgi:outer membrane receptor for ferric coprogen and ferric-rhodotorulic acid
MPTPPPSSRPTTCSSRKRTRKPRTGARPTPRSATPSPSALNGLSLGLAARYQFLPDRNAISIGGQQVIAATKADAVYVVSPFAIYRHRFGRYLWTGQINVNNVFDRVVQMSPGYRFTRYSDPRQIILTSTLAF